MSTTMPDSEPPLPPPAVPPPPDSPDVLEELEEEAQQMLNESQVPDSLGDSLGTTDLFAELDATVAENAPEPEDAPTAGAGSREDLDDEVAAALEAELFGDAADAPGSIVDSLEAELFGPSAMGAKEAGAEIAAAVDAELSRTGGAAAAGAESFEETLGAEEAAAAERELSERELFGSPARGASEEREPGSTATEKPQRASPLPSDLEAQREADEGPYDPKTSRYMRDAQGVLWHKWKVDYASRGGGGSAQCRDQDCLERHAQGGVRSIEKGCLRIGRRVMMDLDKSGEGSVTMLWHHARCIFNTFLRARKTTRILETEHDIEGFSAITPEDQDALRRLIEGNDNIRNVRFRVFEGHLPEVTPPKRGRGPARVAGGGDPGANPVGVPPETPAMKRRRKLLEDKELRVGDRLWTHFRCLPRDAVRDGAPPGVVLGPVKSEKPELAMAREEITNGTVVVQFESEAHEKDRTELYKSRRGKKIKGWLRYPRLFEGKKQRVPVTWIQWNRTPPLLCGCTRQEWGHKCDCGIACNRGHGVKVWGVGDTPA